MSSWADCDKTPFIVLLSNLGNSLRAGLQVRKGADMRIGPAAVLDGCWLGGRDKGVPVGGSEVCTVDTGK